MSCDHRVRHYQKFLKTLKRPESKQCSCPDHIHPRNWVPPPCMSSRTQKEEGFSRRRTLSNPEIRMRSSLQHTKADDDEHDSQSLQHLYNEARVLKEAINKVRKGEDLTRDSHNVIKKWSHRSPRHRTRSDPESQRQVLDHEEEIDEIDRSFAEAVKEEKFLKNELKKLRQISDNKDTLEKENRKLKKKIRQLQHRMKRQDEAQRVSRESLQAEREMGSRDEYILLSLKKKYDDLLQYVLKVESENQKLKSLHGVSGDGDEFLHDYDRENEEHERRNTARLQAELDSLRSELMEKNGYILKCEEHLQAVEALKNENIALHKSLRNIRDGAEEPDPADIGRALEEEWMRRLSETREMYERAIDGYRNQVQELQEKFHNTEVNHNAHVEELMHKIDEMQRVDRSESLNSSRGANVQGSNLHRDGETANRDEANRANVHGSNLYRDGETANRDEVNRANVHGSNLHRDGETANRDEVNRANVHGSNLHRDGETANRDEANRKTFDQDERIVRVVGREEAGGKRPSLNGLGDDAGGRIDEHREVSMKSEEAIKRYTGDEVVRTVNKRDPNERIGSIVDADSGIGGKDSVFGRSGDIDASAESLDASASSSENKGKTKNSKETNSIAYNQRAKNKEERRKYQKEIVKVSDQSTQTKSPKSLSRTGFRNEDNLCLDVDRGLEELQESREFLDKVNHLVKRLESMELKGEGVENILSVIRDTINGCLHDWRITFQHQKTTERDSAEENRGYADLQRKLRSKSKQLESQQKQCRQLEDQNSKLVMQNQKLEAKVATVAQTSDRLNLLQDLPQTLRNTEEKLSEFQEAFQRAQKEKISLQEQIKNLIEKLNRKETKVAAERGHVHAKADEIRTLNDDVALLKHDLDERSREISLLKEQLLTKDAILEHTSAQLEERIRECASLSSQIECQKVQLNEEARNTQVHLNKQENLSHKQLLELQAQLVHYQAQLSSLRSEKDQNDKSLRQNIRKLEEQIDQLQLRNSTLQRQLTTITSTYHSMFTSSDTNLFVSQGLGTGSTDNKP